MTTETSNARGEVVAWEARDPDDGTLWVTRHASERDGWMGLGRTIRPLIYGDAPPPAAARGDVRGLLRRIDAAIDRVTTGRGYMRVPAEDTDPDLVLADARNWIEAALAAEGVRCETCNDRGQVGGPVGQTAESFGYETFPCPDCAEGVQAGEVETRAREREMLCRAVSVLQDWRAHLRDTHSIGVAIDRIAKFVNGALAQPNVYDYMEQRVAKEMRGLKQAALSQQPDARGNSHDRRGKHYE